MSISFSVGLFFVYLVCSVSLILIFVVAAREADSSTLLSLFLYNMWSSKIFISSKKSFTSDEKQWNTLLLVLQAVVQSADDDGECGRKLTKVSWEMPTPILLRAVLDSTQDGDSTGTVGITATISCNGISSSTLNVGQVDVSNRPAAYWYEWIVLWWPFLRVWRELGQENKQIIV